MTSRRALRSLAGLALLAATAACSSPTADDHLARADQFRANGQAAEAVIEYRTALQIDPQRGDIRVKLAEVYLEQRNPAGALREYVRAADLLTGDVETQLKAGSLLLLAGAYDDAKARAEKALELQPSSGDAMLLMANAMAGLRDLDGALSQFQEAAALNPSQAGAHLGIGAVQLAKGDAAAAEASFNHAVEVAPASLEARLARANFLWASRRLPEAEQELRAALGIDPSNVLANRALGMFYLTSNRAAEAEPHFKAIADTLKTPETTIALSDYYVLTRRPADARLVLQQLAMNEDAWAEATTRLAAVDAIEGMRAQGMERVREVLERFPDDRPARLLLARLLLADGGREDALAEANVIIQNEPNAAVVSDAYMVAGEAHARLDRPDAAIKAYQEALSRSQQPFAAAMALASLHVSIRDLSKATTYVQQALQVQPRQPAARALRVRILLAEGNRSQAASELASLEQQFPDAAPVLILRGAQQATQGQLAAARASYARAAELAPNDLEPLAGLVQLDLASGRAAEAIARVEQAMKLADRSSDLMILAARTYGAAGDSARAEDLLRKAIDLDPARLRAYGLLAQLYVGQNRLPEAGRQYEAMVERNPTSVSHNTMLGIIYDMQNRHAEAEDQYRRTLTLDRTAAVAANNLAYRYAEVNTNIDEALELARTAQQRLPGDYNVSDTLGWVYYRKGMTSQAIRELETAVKLNATDPLARYHLGMAYHQAGEIEKARRTLREALDLGADFPGADAARRTLGALGGS
jgi:tetratricopeptide (TPR) repeat protein